MDDVEELRGDVFKGFRKHNVIEYKGPGDSLDIRTVHKVIGYANFIIGTTVYKDEVLADDISITVFRAARCDELIRSLESTDALVRTDTPGVYLLTKKVSNLPFQIVITNELQGSENAFWRALTDHASEGDVNNIIQALSELDDAALKNIGTVLPCSYPYKEPRFV